MAPPNLPTSGPAEDHLTDRLLVGRYRLNRPIASGGMAQVWEATDETLARRVAVKVLHPHLARDESFVRRFRAEAVAAARLAHPSIVSVYDTFTTEGIEAIVMELVVGTTMRADLDQHGPMRLDAVLAIGTQVADALGAAHASGLVHRDVKPANILLSADGRVLVTDFGIAKAAEGNDLTTAGAMVGTAKYLAPEQVEGGPIDGRADLYALGVVLYEALAGVAPFVEDTDAATALARLRRPPVPPRQIRPEIPPRVEAVVLQAMAKEPEGRFNTAAAMRTALVGAGADPGRAPAAAREAVAHAPGPTAPIPPPSAPVGAALAPPPPRPQPARIPDAPPTPMATPAEAPVRRRRPLVLAIVVVLAVAAITAAVVLRDPSGASSAGPLAIAGAASFDPQGDNGAEHEDQVPNAIDDDPATAWRSEPYRDPEAMAGKDGVGLVLRLEEPATVTGVDIQAPDGGWSGRVYVASGDQLDDLRAWGEPRASVSSASSGTTRLAVPSATGDRVLVWFTRTPPSGVMAVSGVTVRGR